MTPVENDPLREESNLLNPLLKKDALRDERKSQPHLY